MALWRILALLCTITILVEAKWYHVQKREAKSSICDPIYNNTNKIQCYCAKEHRDSEMIKHAECYLTVENVTPDDQNWEDFKTLKNATKINLTNTKGFVLKYIPTNAFKHTTQILKLDIKYANIEKVDAYAFANLTLVEDITLRDNQIKTLGPNAFAHHPHLKTIGVDGNNLMEINRDVFVDLPSLERLFLTGNKITTIHDRAFVHLSNLRELEIDRNSLFSLNSETFSGLKKLHRLDLSSNSLEVIGDNTFLPLINLHTLNLEGNKIQMLDEQAFRGLISLQSLSLAHNKLKDIDNVKTFEGLDRLISLSLRGNQLRELKSQVMGPIITNFYGSSSGLDVEDNNFPCDCRLDWFMTIMNKTQNGNLKLALENFKCYPDADLRERWNKSEEPEKNSGQVFEEEESLQAQGNDYEYYDDTQLNGKLFYTDIRHLLNCTGSHAATDSTPMSSATKSTTVKSRPTTVMTKPTETTTKATSRTVTVVTFKPNIKPKIEHKTEIKNAGLLDLSLIETTVKPAEEVKKSKDEEQRARENEVRSEKKHDSTTNRLVTVSEKPEAKHDYEGMASDEAKPDKLKAQRSVQEMSDVKTNGAQTHTGCVFMLVSTVICRFVFL